MSSNLLSREQRRDDIGYYNYFTAESSIYSIHKAVVAAGMQGNPAAHGNSIQTAAKCPHGFPGGGCPICMGKAGGGGGGADKKKSTGMSWGEAYYVWMNIQKDKINMAQDKKNADMAHQRLKILEKIQATLLYQKAMMVKNLVMQYVDNIRNTLINTVNSFKQATVKVVNSIINTVNKMVNITKTTITSLIGVANKLAAIMGEKIKLTIHLIRENIKKIVAKLLKKDVMNSLIMVFNNTRQSLQEFFSQKADSVKEKLFKLFSKFNLLDKEKSDEQQKNKKNNHKNKKNKRKKDRKWLLIPG